MPTMKTTGNSRPLAACMVMRVTEFLLVASSALDIKVASARKSDRVSYSLALLMSTSRFFMRSSVVGVPSSTRVWKSK